MMMSQAGMYVSMHCDGSRLDINARHTTDGENIALCVSAGRQEVTLFMSDAQVSQLATYLSQLAQDRMRIAIEQRGPTDQELSESM